LQDTSERLERWRVVEVRLWTSITSITSITLVSYPIAPSSQSIRIPILYMCHELMIAYEVETDIWRGGSGEVDGTAAQLDALDVWCTRYHMWCTRYHIPHHLTCGARDTTSLDVWCTRFQIPAINAMCYIRQECMHSTRAPHTSRICMQIGKRQTA